MGRTGFRPPTPTGAKMKFALFGLFFALSVAFLAAYEMSHNVIPAILAGVLALGAIWTGCGVLDTYKGDKR